MSFRSRLKEARERKGLTRPELANLLGLSKSAISNYENGVSSPKEEIMYNIFDVLEVDPNFLFQDEYNPQTKSGFSAFEEQLLEKCRQLNDTGQERLMNSLDDLIYSGRYARNNTTPTEPESHSEPTEVPLEASSKKRHWAEEMAEEMDVEAETEQYRQRLIEMKKAKERSSVLKSLEKNA